MTVETITEPGTEYWAELEEQFDIDDGGRGGDFNNNGVEFNIETGGDDGEGKKGHEPYSVQHLVGKITLEECVYELEEMWEQGYKLSAYQQELLRTHEELVDYQE